MGLHSQETLRAAQNTCSVFLLDPSKGLFKPPPPYTNRGTHHFCLFPLHLQKTASLPASQRNEARMASISCSTPHAPLLLCPFPSLLACLGLHPLLTSQACTCPHALKLLYHPPLRHHLNVPRLPSWEKHPASNLQSALIIILFFTAKLLEMSLPSSLPSANSGLPPRTSGKTHTSLVLAAKLHQHISDRPPLFLSPLPSPTHTPACPCIWRTHLFPLPPSLLFKL